MIGVFDSGLGGLTILRALRTRFPAQPFLYLGDHAHAPYGDRPSAEIVELTRAGVARLFALGARLVVLGCNTATAVALRTLQREWLPRSEYAGHGNVIGIVAPTVEAATQTPWAVTKPQYPQKHNRDVIAVFGTTRTIESGVYAEEIRKRCPRVRVLQQACSGLAAAIERARPPAELDAIVADGVAAMLEQLGGPSAPRAAGPRQPDRAILGCTHFSLVEKLFAENLPAGVRILSQPEVVADSLEDYLGRHPEYAAGAGAGTRLRLLTTGEPDAVSRTAEIFWAGAPRFERA